MLDLETPGSLTLLAETIKNDIDAACVAKYSAEGHRGHLGASQIGKPCSRSLWYNFRWVYFKIHDGRQYRLFQRGHFEEARFTMYLEMIGCKVKALDKILLYHAESESLFYGTENDLLDGLVSDVEGIPEFEQKARELGIYLDKGKRQIRIYGCQDHFAGSLDALIELPKRYNIVQDVLFLGEYKTQATQKFPQLVEQGVVIKKYEHWCQQCVYGYKLGLDYGVYIVVNKNDDDLHIEVVKLDHYLAKELENKAEKIIFSQVPPVKISASPDYFDCNWCDYKQVCWFGKEADVNCRSCARCKPVEKGQWFCNYYNSIVPKEFIRSGCKDNWISII
jgi:hypothetical protein